jgi:dTMP kinase
MLYALNRWEKKGEVESSLATCDVLIVNRYSASNLAYGTAIGLKLEWLANLERGLPVADFVIVLDAPPSFLSLRRGPDKDRYERNLGLQEKVRRAYLELAEEFKWAVVDATQGIQDTHLAVIARVSEVLERGGRSA